MSNLNLKLPTLAKELRFCKDIGMFTIDRSIPASCVHATSFCKSHCFNNKLYTMYKDMVNKDSRNELAWNDNDAFALRDTLSRRKLQTSRARFMSRGEALRDYNDIKRIENILQANPETVWWLPTRAWRNTLLFAMAYDVLSKYSNIRILASMDISNSQEDWDHVVNGLGLSTMYFDKQTKEDKPTTPLGNRFFLCPKTHKHLKGHCAICKAGCFSDTKRVDVHLLQH